MLERRIDKARDTSFCVCSVDVSFAFTGGDSCGVRVCLLLDRLHHWLHHQSPAVRPPPSSPLNAPFYIAPQAIKLAN